MAVDWFILSWLTNECTLDMKHLSIRSEDLGAGVRVV